MTIKEQIKSDMLLARRNRQQDKLDLLSCIIGELDRIAKNPTNDECIKCLKKISEGIKETSNNVSEIEYINSLLPKQMNQAEILDAITNLSIELGIKDFPKLMKEFSNRYKGLADNKVVSRMIKNL